MRSDEKGRLFFFKSAWKYNSCNGWGEEAAARKASSCVNRQMTPTNVSTPIPSSSESEAGPAASHRSRDSISGYASARATRHTRITI